MPWKELERRLSNGRAPGSPSWNAGGDSPAWSRKRQPYEPAAPAERRRGSVPYAELHCHSNFSFLDGASHPEELAEEAARLGLEALALTDHDGLLRRGPLRRGGPRRRPAHGVRRRADPRGRPRPQNGVADPRATTWSSWPTGRRATPAWPAPSARPSWPGRRARPGPRLAELAERRARRPLAGAHRLPQGHGARRPAGRTARPRPAGSCAGWSAAFGRDQRGRRAVGPRRPARLGPQRRPGRAGRPPRRRPASPPTTSTTPRPARRPLATALAAVRARRSLDELDGWLPAAGGAHLRSGAEQARRFARYPGVVERAAELGPGVRLRPAAGGAAPPAVPVPRRPRRDELPAASSSSEGAAAPLRPAGPSDARRLAARSTTSWR